MDDKVIPFRRTFKKRTTLSIEETILKAAKVAFADLKESVKGAIKEENSDIFNNFSHLTGITTMIEIKNHGLSKHLVCELKIIDAKALHLMRIVSGIQID